jgi:hypothetical protein
MAIMEDSRVGAQGLTEAATPTLTEVVGGPLACPRDFPHDAPSTQTPSSRGCIWGACALRNDASALWNSIVAEADEA